MPKNKSSSTSRPPPTAIARRTSNVCGSACGPLGGGRRGGLGARGGSSRSSRKDTPRASMHFSADCLASCGREGLARREPPTWNGTTCHDPGTAKGDGARFFHDGGYDAAGRLG